MSERSLVSKLLRIRDASNMRVRSSAFVLLREREKKGVTTSSAIGANMLKDLNYPKMKNSSTSNHVASRTKSPLLRPMRSIPS